MSAKASVKKVTIFLAPNELAGICFLKDYLTLDLTYSASYEYEEDSKIADVYILQDAMTSFNDLNAYGVDKKNFKILDETRRHSLSINDIVKIDDICYSCSFIGWKIVDNIKII